MEGGGQAKIFACANRVKEGIMDFGLWVWDYGFRIMDVGLWISYHGFRIMDFGSWIWVYRLYGLWIWDYGFRIMAWGF